MYYVNGREKCAEEPKILCGCLARGSVFCRMVYEGQKWQRQGTLHLVPWMSWISWLWTEWFDNSWCWLCLISIFFGLRFLSPFYWYFVVSSCNFFFLLFQILKFLSRFCWNLFASIFLLNFIGNIFPLVELGSHSSFYIWFLQKYVLSLFFA